MLSLHDMSTEAGTSTTTNENITPDDPVSTTAGPLKIRLPTAVNLSHERLSSEGLFLLENASDLFLWIGRAVSPAIINTLFSVTSLDTVDIATVSGLYSSVKVLLSCPKILVYYILLYILQYTDTCTSTYCLTAIVYS
jgi:Gelsolin repeat